MSGHELEIVIPVYNEGVNILPVLKGFSEKVKTPFRVLICYDFEEDNTLPAIASLPQDMLDLVLVRNHERGPHAAVRAGFAASTAGAVLVYMADDDYNIGLIDRMMQEFRNGADIVAASRFMPGGHMEGGPFFKALLARAATFSIYHFGRAPIHDATNAFKLFSRRVLDEIDIESRRGFTFGIELMVKASRMGWKVVELPAQWFERTDKPSRFNISAWMGDYLHWYLYAFATFWLRKGPDSVKRKKS
ncbi:MAG: glycosyltransferase family 2 protein [Alphaproteobacteria bacterium]|nr:glycosyltransferase family 2 protein [Alphaproteobacteria bacterium]